MSAVPTPLIHPATLASWSAEPPVLLDVRWQLGGPDQRPVYEQGHLPGAAYVDLETALAGPPGDGGRHPMPTLEAFQDAMRAAGVSSDSSVVVYDAGNSLAASRCWWLLRYFGHQDVRVLDGGYAAWLAAGLPTESGPSPQRSGDFVASPGAEVLLSAEEAGELARTGLLLDGRPAPRFHGREETIDPVAGHIPGAVSAPALANLQPDGRFLDADDLALRFTALGVETHEQVGVYCGSGVQAAHLALALEASGVQSPVGVYIGSWSDWITDPDRPVAS